MPSSFNLLAPKQIKTWGPGQFGGSVQLGNAVVISDGFAIFIPKGIIGKKSNDQTSFFETEKKENFSCQPRASCHGIV